MKRRIVSLFLVIAMVLSMAPPVDAAIFEWWWDENTGYTMGLVVGDDWTSVAESGQYALDAYITEDVPTLTAKLPLYVAMYDENLEVIGGPEVTSVEIAPLSAENVTCTYANECLHITGEGEFNTTVELTVSGDGWVTTARLPIRARYGEPGMVELYALPPDGSSDYVPLEELEACTTQLLLLYADVGSSVELAMDLTSSDESVLQVPRSGDSGETSLLRALKTGTVDLQFSVDDVRYTVPLEVVPPKIGCFQAPIYGENTRYTNNAVPFVSGAGGSFWILKEDGFETIRDIEADAFERAGFELEFVELADGGAIKVTIPPDAADGSYSFNMKRSYIAYDMTLVETTTPYGMCGSDLKWQISQSDRETTLTITGTGAMLDYEGEDANRAPWTEIMESFSSLNTNVVVDIGEGVTNIDTHAFSGCKSLQSFHVADGNTAYSAVDGALCSKDGTTLIKVPNGLSGSYTVPEGVTAIAASAFSGCAGLTAVTFLGDAPAIASDSFRYVTAECRYPYGNTTWTETAKQNYGGTLTWTADGEPEPQLHWQAVRRMGDYSSTDWMPVGECAPFENPLREGYMRCPAFFYGTDAEHLTPVTDLAVTEGSEYLQITQRTYDYEGQSGIFYELTCRKPGSGTLSFTVNGETVTQAFTVDLPVWSCFSSNVFDREYWYEDWVIPYTPGQELEFWYLCLYGFSADDVYRDNSGLGLTVDMVELEDGTYGIRVKVPATLTGDHSVSLSWYDAEGNVKGGSLPEFTLVDQTPKLYMEQMFTHTGTGAPDDWYASGRVQEFSGKFYVNYYNSYRFMYGTHDHLEEVSITVHQDDEYLQVYEHVYEENGISGTVYLVKNVGIGSGTISYTVNGTTRTVPFEVGAPQAGLFSTDVYATENWLTNDTAAYVPGVENEFWFLQDGGFGAWVSMSEISGLGLTVERITTSEGKYGFRIVVPETLSGDHNVTLELVRENDNYTWTDTIRLVDGSARMWFREQRVDENGAVYEDETMPLMPIPIYIAGSRDLYLYYGSSGNELPVTDAEVIGNSDVSLEAKTDRDGNRYFTITASESVAAASKIQTEGGGHSATIEIVAAENEICGYCGQNAIWQLSEDGVLTISGKHSTTWNWPGQPNPWYAYSDQIKKVVVEEGIRDLGSAAFIRCRNLTSVTLPSSLRRFDTGDSFYGCSSLMEILVPEDNQNFCSVDGILYNKNMTILHKVPDAYGDAVQIPETVTLVDWYGCISGTTIKSVTFTGDAPDIYGRNFEGATLTCYYPANNPTWTEDKLQDYGGTVTWVPVGGEEQLYFRAAQYDGTNWYEDTNVDAVGNRELDAGFSMSYYLYYGAGDSLQRISAVKPVDANAMTVSSDVDNSGETVWHLQPRQFGAIPVRITVDGRTFTTTVTSVLPDHGLYSAWEHSEAAYLPGFESEYYAGTEKELWFLLPRSYDGTETVSVESDRVTAVHLEHETDGRQWIKLTVSENLSGDYGCLVAAEGSGRLYSFYLRLKDRSPVLLYSSGEWINGLWQNYPEYGIQAEPLIPGVEKTAALYLRDQTAGTTRRVVTIEPVDDTLVSIEPGQDTAGKPVFTLCAEQVGSIRVRVTVEGDTVPYDTVLVCAMPELAAFSAAEFSAEALYLKDRVPFLAGRGGEFWIMSQSGFDGSETVSCGNAELGLSWNWVDTEQAGVKALHVTIPTDLQKNTNTSFRFTTANGNTRTLWVELVCEPNVIDCQTQGIDTVEKLNRALAQSGMYGPVTIQLIPGHTYEGVIAGETEFEWNLIGGTDTNGRQTTLIGGVQSTGYLETVSGICFVAPDQDETVAVLGGVYGVGFVDHCVFCGYNVALNGIRSTSNCLFVENGTAMTSDYANMKFGGPSVSVYRCTFVDNDTAMEVRSLSESFGARDIYVTQCDFVGNGIDFAMPETYSYYYHGNFFGGKDLAPCAAKVRGEVYTELVNLQPTTGFDTDKTVWWKDVLKDWNIIGSSGGSDPLDAHMSKVVQALSGIQFPVVIHTVAGVSPGAAKTAVWWTEASAMRHIEAAGLTAMTEDLDIELHVKDGMGFSDGTPLVKATWHLKAGVVIPEEMTAAFTPKIGFEGAPGQVTITIPESDMLAVLKPELTFDVIHESWEYVAAAEGTEAEPTWDAKQNALTFPVTAGGTYVFRSAKLPQATIAVGSTEGLTGDTVTVPVTISGNTGIAGFTFDVVYDTDALELSAIKRGTILTPGSLTASIRNHMVTWISTTNMARDGEILLLEFKIKDTCAAGTYDVALRLTDGLASNLSNEASQHVPVVFAGGSVTVKTYLLGDLTGDREVAATDLAKLAKALVRDVTLNDREKRAADITGEGEITSADAIRLARYLADLVTVLDPNAPQSISLLAEEKQRIQPGAAGTTVVSMDAVAAVAGSEVVVPVRISSNPGLLAFALRLDYDPAVLTLQEVRSGDLTANGEMVPNLKDGCLVYFTGEDIVGDGVLFNLVFRVSEQAPEGLAAVALSLRNGSAENFSDSSMEALPVSFETGGVSVGEAAMQEVRVDGNKLSGTLVLAEGLDLQTVQIAAALFDASGKMLHYENLDIAEGQNEVTLQYNGSFEQAYVFVLDQQHSPMTIKIRAENVS